MTNNNHGPKTPKIDQLNAAMDTINSLLEGEQSAEAVKQYENVYNILDWALTFLDNRRLYHKKMQLKNKLMVNALKAHFNGDLSEIEKMASVQADKELFEVVANEPPDTMGGE